MVVVVKKIFLIILFLFPLFVYGKDITKDVTIKLNENNINNKIIDNNEKTYLNIKKDETINISSNEEIDALYIVYELESKTGIINSDNKEIKIGQNNFLHEYIKINEEKNLQIKYDEDVKIAEIYILSKGVLPEYVEVWNPPCEEADLMLLSTHSDDEQLFFLGLLPTYVARGANIEVVYFTNHFDNPQRLHEQLHGLYEVGIRNYPIIGIIPDAWSETLEGAIKNLEKKNLAEDDALTFQVEMIRRFKPLVIVGHDELGEYSHGQHILNTYILKKAIIKANDQNYDKASYQKYGLWSPAKVYLHLYQENPIIMDYDTPLEYFNGETAYEVSKKGYSKHLSQQWTWFTAWINGKNNEYTKSTDIKTYSPNQFGLYYTEVGIDEDKNDMFEHLTLRKDIIKEEILEKDDDKNIKENNKIKYWYIIPYIILFIIIVICLIRLFKRKK